MKTIPITQFLHPSGNIRPVTCDVDDDVGERYENVIKPLGLRVTAECIQHSHFVNLCLEEPELGDFSCVLAENSAAEPEIVLEALATLQPAVLDRMVRKAVAPFRDATLKGRVDAARREWERQAQSIIDEQIDREALAEANERLDALRAHVAAEIEAINSLKAVDVDKLAFPAIVVPEAIDNSDEAPEPLIDSEWDFADHAKR